ncbi:MAG: ketopantoate reductase family protein [Paracoccaceae bacterium]
MRVVVYGMGAIGGSIAAALTRAGHEVIGIARGPHLDAIRAQGLRFRAPDLDEYVAVPCVAAPDQVTFRPDDAILLVMKTQDTVAALHALRAAGVTDQPIFCMQNGVANERMALRVFPNVHGVTVMMPATYLVPGEVAAFGTPNHGMFDVGCAPAGQDECDQALCEVLNGSGFAAFPTDNVMSAKHGKVLMNLGNILRAAVGKTPDLKPFHSRLKDEAMEVFRAAGIAWHEVDEADPRRADLLRFADVPGVERGWGSTAQSLKRGQPLETDYLNGEIVLQGRLVGVPTPLNAAMCRLAADLAGRGAGLASMEIRELTEIFDAASLQN